MSTSKSTQHFVYDTTKLVFSEESFSPQIPHGDAWKSTLRFHAEDGREIRGKVSSDHLRIILAEDTFQGTEIELLFGIDTAGLGPEETVSGSIRICSNLSEYQIPIEAHTVTAPEEDFPERVHSLEDFAVLCKKNLREGFRVFTHPAFPRLLRGAQEKWLPLYQGMSKNPVTYQHLEEFLIATGCKEPVALSLEKQEKAVYHLDSSQQDSLTVYKNNWGYVHAEIEVQGQFLEVEREEITAEDFLGNTCTLRYVVHRERLGKGRSFGCIRIHTVHQDLCIEIEASAREESEIQPATVRNRRISWLMRDYLKLQLHQLDYRTWQDTSALTVGEMLEEDPTDVLAILYTAYLQYTRDDNAKAMEVLWPIKDGSIPLETKSHQAMYRWLAKKIGLLPAEEQDLEPFLSACCAEEPDHYLFVSLLQQEREDHPLSQPERLQQLEDCFDAGCTSPFLYLDAWETLSREEALLRKLSPFLTQVLCFGQKQGLLTEGLLKRAAFLSANQKQYSGAVFRLLTRGYAAFPEDEILEAVCQLLIKGEPRRPECFPWYARAVKRDLHITRLYEYYMETYSLPAEETLPQPVRMYFATNTDTLSENTRALLYASIILHKEEDPTGYMNYAKSMRTYAWDSLQRGKIDKNYAVLYRHFFSKPETPEIAEKMTQVLFAWRVTVSNPEIRQIVVRHTALEKEQYYPCKEGVAYPRIYSENACLLFEDERHRRFAATVTCTREPLFPTQEIARACLYQAVDDAGLALYLCKEQPHQMRITEETVEDYRMAERNEAFTEAYRQSLRRKLLEFDLSHAKEGSSVVIPPEQVEAYARADRSGTIQVLIHEARFAEAYHVVIEYGYERVPKDLLLRLASRMIERRDYAPEEELLSLTADVFRSGKYDEVMLRYLQMHYEGPVKELCALRDRLDGFGMETVDIEEKILCQSMETRQFPPREAELLLDYQRQFGRQEVVGDFLTYLARYYFLRDRETEDRIFVCLEAWLSQEKLDADVCKLALLKYYAEIESLTEEQCTLAKTMLHEMNDKGYRFEFYRKLPQKVIQAYQIEDRVFLEEHFTPNSRVILQYRLQEQGGEPGEWISEPMPRVYEGIFVKEFLLFYGETLTYYLRVMENGVIRNTDMYEISLSDMDTSGSTRYALLNRMLEMRDHQDEAGYRAALHRYQKQEAVVSDCLPLWKEDKQEGV